MSEVLEDARQQISWRRGSVLGTSLFESYGHRRAYSLARVAFPMCAKTAESTCEH